MPGSLRRTGRLVKRTVVGTHTEMGRRPGHSESFRCKKPSGGRRWRRVVKCYRLRMPNGDADFQRVCEIDFLRDG